MAYKCTHDILRSISGRINADLWEQITDIPEFEPAKHSDGCSGGMSAAYAMLPDWVHGQFGETLPWRHCCVEHDRAYYYGGTRGQKRAADEALKSCVASAVGEDVAALLLSEAMRIAVTIGGQPFFSTPYRWGYGEDFRGTEGLPAEREDKT
ncbi:MAG: hypothetical protein U9Q81_02860 [Pseudomonadota bacterium]|nr:hypothetical protein [Pseudomonadota bacterium]